MREAEKPIFRGEYLFDRGILFILSPSANFVSY